MKRLVKLNQALLSSFDHAGITMGDHHEMGRAFEGWCQAEAKQGREVPGDWSWLTPPISGSLTPQFHRSFSNAVVTHTNYFYQEPVKVKGMSYPSKAKDTHRLLGRRCFLARPATRHLPVQQIVFHIQKPLVMTSHEIDYTIYGDDLQAVEVELDPQETVIAEAGAMNWMEQDIAFEAKMGDGSTPNQGFFGGLLNVGKRVLTGESIFMTHFTNVGVSKRRVAFSSPYPGKIMPVDLKQRGGTLLCQKDAFLCAAKGTKVSIAFNKRFGAGFFGGEGFILQKLQGDGLAFLHAGGTVVERHLNNETLRVDTGCIVGFTPGIDYNIEASGGLKSMFFGGEGLFLATLRGTGTVYLQTLPFSRLADRVIRHAPALQGRSKGEGSVLGSLGRMVDGDNF